MPSLDIVTVQTFFFLSHPETPTNTTKTAAYVAVDTIVSVLLALKKTDTAPANASTEIDTVTKLFTTVASGRRMINMGTTSIKPPKNATRNRARLSTKGETSSGGLSFKYSSVLFWISCLVYANDRGRWRFKALRRLSVGRSVESAKRRYPDPSSMNWYSSSPKTRSRSSRPRRACSPVMGVSRVKYS